MDEFFAADFDGHAFESLGQAHVGALVILLALNLLLAWLGRRAPGAGVYIRWAMASVLWAAEASWHLWNLAIGTWTVQTMLPLNTCSILIWLSGLMLIRRDFRIYEFAYFLGIGGALQYLATPDLGRFGFPHFRFFQTFASHGLLLTAAIYMTVVERMRPSWRSIGRVVLWTNLYMAVTFFVNLALGSNYLMLNAKPPTASILDVLPPWPYYIAFMELLGLATFLLLYLPFLLADARRSQQLSRGRPP